MKNKMIIILLLILANYSYSFAPSNISLPKQKDMSLKQLKQDEIRKREIRLERFLDFISIREKEYFKYIKWTDKDLFYEKLEIIADSLQIQPEFLMLIIHSESRFNPKAQNKIKATGLIQFLPKTAKGLKTSVDSIIVMSRVQQLDYIYAYFKPIKGKVTSIEDLYLFTMFPMALNKSDDYVFRTKRISAKKIAKLNYWADLNKDQQITKLEFKTFLNKKYYENAKSKCTK